jgi:hypothetical protein
VARNESRGKANPSEKAIFTTAARAARRPGRRSAEPLRPPTCAVVFVGKTRLSTSGSCLKRPCVGGSVRGTRIAFLPSRCSENQPLFASETMITGMPMNGSDRGDIREVLLDCGCALFER